MDLSLYQLVGKYLGKPVKTHVLIEADLEPFSSLLSISHDSHSYPDGCQGQKGELSSSGLDFGGCSGIRCEL